MFFSERLECSSFDKLKRNFSEKSRKKFAQFSDKVFCQEQSSQFSSVHLKRSFDNPAETFGESPKIFNAKFGKQWMKDLFQEKFPDNFSTGDLKCSFDQFGEKILSEVWEILWFSQTGYLFIYIFFDLWFNWSWKLPLKKLIWTRKM